MPTVDLTKEAEAKNGFLHEGWNAKRVTDHLGVDRSTAYRRIQEWRQGRPMVRSLPINLLVGYDFLTVDCIDHVFQIVVKHPALSKPALVYVGDAEGIAGMLYANKVQHFDLGDNLAIHQGLYRAFKNAADKFNIQI
jgi:hypothetical protein